MDLQYPGPKPQEQATRASEQVALQQISELRAGRRSSSGAAADLDELGDYADGDLFVGAGADA
ncbi:MAG: hypothetical protein ACI84E_002133 [Planctomycetota bacterium]|jgi:hypothetical protein